MQVIPPLVDSSVGALVREAIDEAKALAKLEVALAKNELEREFRAVARAAIALGVAAAMALLATILLVMALVLALAQTAWLPLGMAVGAIAIGAICAVVGFRMLPKKPLEQTRARLEGDAQALAVAAHAVVPVVQPTSVLAARVEAATLTEQTP